MYEKGPLSFLKRNLLLHLTVYCTSVLSLFLSSAPFSQVLLWCFLWLHFTQKRSSSISPQCALFLSVFLVGGGSRSGAAGAAVVVAGGGGDGDAGRAGGGARAGGGRGRARLRQRARREAVR